MDQTNSTTTKRTLLDLINTYEELLTEILSRQGEVTDEIAKLFEANSEQLQEKVETYVWLIERLEIEAEYKKQKSVEFGAKAKACLGMAESISRRAKDLMTFANIQRLKGIDHEMVLKKTKPALIFNEDIKHWEFTPYLKSRIEQEIDKEALRLALDAGQTIDGARLEERFSLIKQVISAKGVKDGRPTK